MWYEVVWGGIGFHGVVCGSKEWYGVVWCGMG